MKRIALSLLAVGMMFPIGVQAANLSCPEAQDQLHHRDIMSTSAPEVKVSASAQDDTGRVHLLPTYLIIYVLGDQA